MGSAVTARDGSYSVAYSPLRQWDTCCGAGTAPDLVADVVIGAAGRRWAQTSEVLNSQGSTRLNINVQRLRVSGALQFGETCGGAAGVAVAVRDDDPVSSEVMGVGATDAQGRYSVDVPPRDGDSPWDTCCGADVLPDVYADFRGGVSGGLLGKTRVEVNRASLAPLDFGTTAVW